MEKFLGVLRKILNAGKWGESTFPPALHSPEASSYSKRTTGLHGNDPHTRRGRGWEETSHDGKGSCYQRKRRRRAGSWVNIKAGAAMPSYSAQKPSSGWEKKRRPVHVLTRKRPNTAHRPVPSSMDNTGGVTSRLGAGGGRFLP